MKKRKCYWNCGRQTGNGTGMIAAKIEGGSMPNANATEAAVEKDPKRVAAGNAAGRCEKGQKPNRIAPRLTIRGRFDQLGWNSPDGEISPLLRLPRRRDPEKVDPPEGYSRHVQSVCGYYEMSPVLSTDHV